MKLTEEQISDLESSVECGDTTSIICNVERWIDDAIRTSVINSYVDRNPHRGLNDAEIEQLGK